LLYAPTLFVFDGVYIPVKNALKGINLCEFTVAKSIPAPTPPTIVLCISLGFQKNFLDVA
jgi:hypothetical protein